MTILYNLCLVGSLLTLAGGQQHPLQIFKRSIMDPSLYGLPSMSAAPNSLSPFLMGGMGGARISHPSPHISIVDEVAPFAEFVRQNMMTPNHMSAMFGRQFGIPGAKYGGASPYGMAGMMSAPASPEHTPGVTNSVPGVSIITHSLESGGEGKKRKSSYRKHRHHHSHYHAHKRPKKYKKYDDESDEYSSHSGHSSNSYENSGSIESDERYAPASSSYEDPYDSYYYRPRKNRYSSSGSSRRRNKNYNSRPKSSRSSKKHQKPKNLNYEGNYNDNNDAKYNNDVNFGPNPSLEDFDSAFFDAFSPTWAESGTFESKMKPYNGRNRYQGNNNRGGRGSRPSYLPPPPPSSPSMPSHFDSSNFVDDFDETFLKPRYPLESNRIDYTDFRPFPPREPPYMSSSSTPYPTTSTTTTTTSIPTTASTTTPASIDYSRPLYKPRRQHFEHQEAFSDILTAPEPSQLPAKKLTNRFVQVGASMNVNPSERRVFPKKGIVLDASTEDDHSRSTPSPLPAPKLNRMRTKPKVNRLASIGSSLSSPSSSSWNSFLTTTGKPPIYEKENSFNNKGKDNNHKRTPKRRLPDRRRTTKSPNQVFSIELKSGSMDRDLEETYQQLNALTTTTSTTTVSPPTSPPMSYSPSTPSHRSRNNNRGTFQNTDKWGSKSNHWSKPIPDYNRFNDSYERDRNFSENTTNESYSVSTSSSNENRPFGGRKHYQRHRNQQKAIKQTTAPALGQMEDSNGNSFNSEINSSNFNNDNNSNSFNTVAAKNNNNNANNESLSSSETAQSWRQWCKSASEGYHARLEDNCQSYVHCSENGLVEHFSCPTGTRFSQGNLVCEWAENVQCVPQH